MKHKPTSPLRKAAILVASLDRKSADALLDQMPAEQAVRVRQAVLDLENIDPAEQQAVIAQFMRGQGAAATHGVEFDPALVRKFSAPESAQAALAASAPTPAAQATPFGALRGASGEAIAKFLRREHPQTVALVLAHLPPSRAAEILAQLPAALQTEVLRRVVDLDETSPDVIRELEQSLEHALESELHARRRHTAGVAAAGAILSATRGTERSGLLANLTASNADLATRLKAEIDRDGESEIDAAPAKGSRFSFFWPRVAPAATAQEAPAIETQDECEPDSYEDEPDEVDTELEEAAARAAPLPEVEFDDFLRFDNRSLARVLKEADPRLAQLAFTGARRELVNRLLDQLPAREAKELKQRLDLAGPLRLRDVEIAQRQLALLAGRLAARGQITLPAARRFAAAA